MVNAGVSVGIALHEATPLLLVITISINTFSIGSPKLVSSLIEKRSSTSFGFHPSAFPASSSNKVFLIIKLGETSLPVIDFIGKVKEFVGPSIMALFASSVVKMPLKSPSVSELVILPISSLMVVPAGTLAGLVTVYINTVGD